jgi:tRNA(Ile)-lysidine synthase
MALDVLTFTKIMTELGPFGPRPRIAVAVSGGPDSLVLCHLVQCWLKNDPASVMALIVDHQLRPESTVEAQLTQQRLQKWGIPSEILTWEGPKPTTRIQERARQARYALLESWCQQHGVIHLLTGHHFDDQWETVVSRLEKKSDLSGLRGILPIVYKPFGRIIRPLLAFTKQTILAYAHDHALDYAVDPSNQNPKYHRVYLRQHRDLLEQQFPPDTIQELMTKATSVTCEHSKKLAQFVVQAVRIDPLGYIEVDRSLFEQLAQALQIEFIRSVGHCMSKSPYPVPKKKALTVVQKIATNTRATLGGWRFIPKKEIFVIVREPRALIHMGNRYDRFIFHKDHCLEGPDNLPSYITETLPPDLRGYLKFLTPLLESH